MIIGNYWKTDKDFFERITFETPQKILMNIEDEGTTFKVITRYHCTYSYSFKVIKKMEKEGLVNLTIGVVTNKVRKNQFLITLTPKGIELRNEIRKLKILMS
jgi:DNA-binding MarR family transcriptional regulator